MNRLLIHSTTQTSQSVRSRLTDHCCATLIGVASKITAKASVIELLALILPESADDYGVKRMRSKHQLHLVCRDPRAKLPSHRSYNPFNTRHQSHLRKKQLIILVKSIYVWKRSFRGLWDPYRCWGRWWLRVTSSRQPSLSMVRTLWHLGWRDAYWLICEQVVVISKRAALLRFSGDGIHGDNRCLLTTEHVLAQLRARRLQAFQCRRNIEEVQHGKLRCWRQFLFW